MPIYEYRALPAVIFRADHEGRRGSLLPRLRAGKVKKQAAAFRTNAWSAFLDRWKSGSARRNRIGNKGSAIEKIHGNLTGLGPAEIKRIGQLYRRRVPPERIITQELARSAHGTLPRDQPPDRHSGHPPGRNRLRHRGDAPQHPDPRLWTASAPPPAVSGGSA